MYFGLLITFWLNKIILYMTLVVLRFFLSCHNFIIMEWSRKKIIIMERREEEQCFDEILNRSDLWKCWKFMQFWMKEECWKYDSKSCFGKSWCTSSLLSIMMQFWSFFHWSTSLQIPKFWCTSHHKSLFFSRFLCNVLSHLIWVQCSHNQFSPQALAIAQHQVSNLWVIVRIHYSHYLSLVFTWPILSPSPYNYSISSLKSMEWSWEFILPTSKLPWSSILTRGRQ